MFIQSGVLGPADLPSKPVDLGCYLRAKALLDKASFAVQKLCREISGLPQALNPVESRKACVDRLGRPVVCTHLYRTATSGETGFIAGAEGATAPETLRQKDRVALTTSGKRRWRA
jgi:hypothetical protein